MSYVGSLEQIPAGWFLCDGTNGTPDLRDRFLEGSGTSPLASMITPGLPNITGSLLSHNGGEWLGTGVFQVKNDPYHTCAWGTDMPLDLISFSFDASRCSPIYQNDIKTVQPAAYTVYFIIRLK